MVGNPYLATEKKVKKSEKNACHFHFTPVGYNHN